MGTIPRTQIWVNAQEISSVFGEHDSEQSLQVKYSIFTVSGRGANSLSPSASGNFNSELYFFTKYFS